MWKWLKNNHHSVTSLAAIAVSVIALFVAWDQSRVMRAQQHGAVIPILQVDCSLDGSNEEGSVNLNIRNNGVGPAMVKSVTMTRNGERFPTAAEMLEFMPPNPDTAWTTVVGRTIAVDDIVNAASMVWEGESYNRQTMYQVVSEITIWDVTVCYCSVLDRCWESTARYSTRIAVQQCPINQADPFEAMGRSVYTSAPIQNDDETSAPETTPAQNDPQAIAEERN